jgi:hypothetical protein
LSYTAQLLPSGDLYLLTGTGSSYSSTGNLWSAAACAWNYTAPQVQTTATYCGVFADGSRLSMVVEPVYQTLTALLQPASSATNVCFYRGVVNLHPMDMAVSPMMYCTGSNHYLAQIVRDAANPSTLTVFVLVYNTNTWMNVTLSNGTCAAWETGLASGEYCTPQGWTMTPGVLVFGSYISFPQGSAVYIANYSIVRTNVTINPNQTYGWNSFGNPTYVSAPTDVFINAVVEYVGPDDSSSSGSVTVVVIGLSLSSYGNGMPYTIAATRFGCPWSTSNVSTIADVAMASAGWERPFSRLIMAVFHNMGNFTMLLPPVPSSSSRCYVNGVFQVMPSNGQLSLQVSQSSPGCTYPFEFNSAMWHPGANVVTFNLSYPHNTMLAVELFPTACGASAMIPATRYCDGEGSVIYTCNGDALSFEYPSSTPVAYGSITANVNGSMTYFSSMQPNYPQLLEYSAQNRTVWVSNFYSTSAAYVSADMCTLPLFEDIANPVVGMYCGTGSIAGTNATAFVLPNGNFYMTLFTLAPNGSAYNTGMCEVIGNLEWSQSTGFGYYATSAQSTNCRFGYYADSAPRVRISSTWYNNETGVITLRGSTWTAPGGEGIDITYTLSAGANCAALSQSPNASLVYYPRGVYTVNGAGLNITTLMLGTRYALYALNANTASPATSVGILSGTYAPNTLSAVASNAGITPTFWTATFGTNNVRNSSFLPGFLQLSPQWAYSSNSQGGHLALPLGYRGVDPASTIPEALTTVAPTTSTPTVPPSSNTTMLPSTNTTMLPSTNTTMMPSTNTTMMPGSSTTVPSSAPNTTTMTAHPSASPTAPAQSTPTPGTPSPTPAATTVTPGPAPAAAVSVGTVVAIAVIAGVAIALSVVAIVMSCISLLRRQRQATESEARADTYSALN